MCSVVSPVVPVADMLMNLEWSLTVKNMWISKSEKANRASGKYRRRFNFPSIPYGAALIQIELHKSLSSEFNIKGAFYIFCSLYNDNPK